MNLRHLSIVFASLILWIIGLATIHSIFPALAPYQLIYGLIGLVLALIISSLNPETYLRLPWLWYGSAIIALLATELFGVVSRGSARWLTIAGTRIQPSEFAKVALIIFMAHYLSIKPINSLNQAVRFVLIMLVPVILILIQPDLGTGLIVAALIGIAILSGGLPLKKVAVLAIIMAAFLPVAVTFLQPYQRQRLATFINPNEDPLGRGYNVRQATIAIGSGKVFGRGMGQGTQSHLKFLPERHTDFIFASFVEEFGFFGGAAVIGLYAWLTTFALNIARKARNLAQTYTIIGISMLILIQAVVNIGMNLGLLPVTGLTLPLVSYGGSSLISTALMLGVLAGCARNSVSRQIELRLQ